MPIVMLVEDNEANLNMLARRLVRRGWTVLCAMDGRQGLQIDGWELTRILKGMKQTRHIPVIALTAHAMQNDREKSLDAGCDEFETKPVDLNRLLEKMADLLGRGSCAKGNPSVSTASEKACQL
jgi:CheY-like chemotaxis protein